MTSLLHPSGARYPGLAGRRGRGQGQRAASGEREKVGDGVEARESQRKRRRQGGGFQAEGGGFGERVSCGRLSVGSGSLMSTDSRHLTRRACLNGLLSSATCRFCAWPGPGELLAVAAQAPVRASRAAAGLTGYGEAEFRVSTRLSREEAAREDTM